MIINVQIPERIAKISDSVSVKIIKRIKTVNNNKDKMLSFFIENFLIKRKCQNFK